MSIESAAPPGSAEARRLSSTLRLVGAGKLILSLLTLTLAFTGYETPRAVNGSYLLIGVNLFMLGALCLTVGKSFGAAADGPAPPALALAMSNANRLFGYYLVLIGLAVLGVGYNTVEFLVKVASR